MPEMTLDELDVYLESAFLRAVASNPRQKSAEWNAVEIAYLHAHHGDQPDHEIAAALGRNENAVKIFRIRQGLPAASRAKKALISSNEASKRLGVEVHAMTWWCDSGLLRCEWSGPKRLMRLVRVSDLTAFAVNPDNWVYFNRARIQDERLRRLCELRAARWNDEWWTTKQVAIYHGVDVKDVTRLIHLGRISAYYPPTSRGGRHASRRWGYWYVRRSVALGLKFLHRGDDMAHSTPEADAWILKARDELHLPYEVIGRLMGSHRKGRPGKTGTTIKNRYVYLQCQIDAYEDALWSANFGGGNG